MEALAGSTAALGAVPARKRVEWQNLSLDKDRNTDSVDCQVRKWAVGDDRLCHLCGQEDAEGGMERGAVVFCNPRGSA